MDVVIGNTWILYTTKYHDQKWGKLVTDDKSLFELLVLKNTQTDLD